MLSTEPAQEFYSSLLFPDSKRPITVDLLCRMDLRALAQTLGCESRFDEFLQGRATSRQHGIEPDALQQSLFA